MLYLQNVLILQLGTSALIHSASQSIGSSPIFDVHYFFTIPLDRSSPVMPRQRKGKSVLEKARQNGAGKK